MVVTLDQERAAKREYMRKWRAKNAENAEKHRAWSRAWAEAHREENRAKARAWYHSNRGRPRPPVDPEKARERNRRYRLRHPEKMLNDRHVRRGKASDTDLTAADLSRLRTEAILCPLCGTTLCEVRGGPWNPARKHFDHVLPVACGGRHVLANVRIICARCNLRRPKDGSDLKELR